MYSIVLATMLTAGAAAPAGCGVFGHGCCGYSCHGGCCFSSCCSYSSCCSCSGVYAYSCCGCGSWSYGCCSCCCGCWSYSGWGCCGCCSGTYSSCSFCGGCSFSSCCSCCSGCCGGVYYLPPYSIGCCCCGCVSNCSSVVVAPVCGVCACYEPAPAFIVPSAPAIAYPAPAAIAAPAYPYAAPGAAYPYAAPATGGGTISPITPIAPPALPSGATTIVPGTGALPRKIPSPASADGNSGRVMIKAPLDVVIRVNGQVIRRTEAVMTFRTPALLPTAVYSYEIEAERNKDGQSLKETRTVSVKPGVESVVEFNAGNLSSGREAIVTLNLPENARLFVDGTPVTLPRGNKTFTTPALVPGETYQYEMKAEVDLGGKTVTETQSVKVAAGKSVTVDFDKINNQVISTVSR